MPTFKAYASSSQTVVVLATVEHLSESVAFCLSSSHFEKWDPVPGHGEQDNDD